MSLLALNSTERGMLEEITTPTALTNEVRRAQALLWLDEGESPQTIAEWLHVSRQTVYNWVTRFKKQRGATDISSCLADEKRSGRPGVFPPIIDPLINDVIEREPLEFGFESHQWTPTTLTHYLRDVHDIPVCRASVSLALRRLNKERKASKRKVSVTSCEIGGRRSFSSSEKGLSLAGEN